MKIDLKDFISKHEVALVGRKDGTDLKNRIFSDYGNYIDLEKANDSIEIVVPHHVEGINNSFWAGLLEEAILRNGKVGFHNIYKVTARKRIMDNFSKEVDEIIRDASQEAILKAMGG